MVEKRKLVDYGSEEDEERSRSVSLRYESPVSSEKDFKPKKLPKLATTFTSHIPVDDPSQHQGRIRNKPHVDGQYAGHAFVSLQLPDSARRLILQMMEEARHTVPAFQLSSDPNDSDSGLHISLSRPIYLRAHQRADLRRAVKSLSESIRPFKVSFSTLAAFTNDERTRIFLALEVGAGHHELSDISKALTPVLRSIRQEGYYAQPRFHASFCWALLQVDERPDILSPQPTEFQRVTSLPGDCVVNLNKMFGEKIQSSMVFEVDELKLKIGKRVHSYNLC